ncbi:hypothetical protein BV25DRAFT_1839985 [Artomyces pyxidatus]|uniref:Uncharacterized protein n=1 Tax=Artomyces pyxidatus TaxID=48021 RepID=A0ACB8SUE7_9AGAM|nr:hypothetical protein BV25DRAFT_1839985 [Artomyces pyxidatus]
MKSLPTTFGIPLLFAPLIFCQFTETAPAFPQSTRTVVVTAAPDTTSAAYQSGAGGTVWGSIDTSASIITGWGVSSNPACYSLCLAQASVPGGCSVTDTRCQCQNTPLLQKWIACLQTTCSPTDLPRAQSMLLFNCPNIPPAWIPATSDSASPPTSALAPTTLPPEPSGTTQASAAFDNSLLSTASPTASSSGLNPGSPSSANGADVKRSYLVYYICFLGRTRRFSGGRHAAVFNSFMCEPAERRETGLLGRRVCHRLALRLRVQVPDSVKNMSIEPGADSSVPTTAAIDTAPSVPRYSFPGPADSAPSCSPDVSATHTSASDFAPLPFHADRLPYEPSTEPFDLAVLCEPVIQRLRGHIGHLGSLRHHTPDEQRTLTWVVAKSFAFMHEMLMDGVRRAEQPQKPQVPLIVLSPASPVPPPQVSHLSFVFPPPRTADLLQVEAPDASWLRCSGGEKRPASEGVDAGMRLAKRRRR